MRVSVGMGVGPHANLAAAAARLQRVPRRILVLWQLLLLHLLMSFLGNCTELCLVGLSTPKHPQTEQLSDPETMNITSALIRVLVEGSNLSYHMRKP